MLTSKFHTYKYKWNSLSLIVDCTKCGNNIVLQNFDGNPECTDCGNTNKQSWGDIIKEIDIPGMKRGGSNHKVMMGSLNGKVQMEDIESINCYHCQQVLTLPAQEELNNYTCNHCSEPLAFKEYEGLDELVFYRADAANKKQEKVLMIAVRCVSCGAPLEADPTKNNFHCKFCSTENILPLSLRYKVVLEDVFVGLRNSKFIKLAAFESNGTIVEQTLRENGKASFEDAELDTILIKNKEDVGIYRQIIDEFKYLPSDKILNEIFNTSNNPTIIQSVGTRLQKSAEEIKYRLDQLKVKAKPKISATPTPHTTPKKSTGSRFKSPFMIIIIIVFVITIIAMINLFLS